MPEIIVAEDLAAAGADWIADRIVASTGTYFIALAGGSTPRPIYERLAKRPLPWERLRLFLGDERDVPTTSPDSNYRMCTEALGRKILPVTSRWEPPRFDLILMGVGEDFHTLSLFPGRPQRGSRLIVVEEAPKPPPRRFSISADVVDEAAELLVIVGGAAKAPIVRDALKLPPDTMLRPIQLALRGTWLVDRAAAGLL